MSENEQPGSVKVDPAPAQGGETGGEMSRRSFLANAGLVAGSVALGGDA